VNSDALRRRRAGGTRLRKKKNRSDPNIYRSRDLPAQYTAATPRTKRKAAEPRKSEILLRDLFDLHTHIQA
jgi:hypothetical protein